MNNLVIQAEPGAGKSTALPLSLIDAAWLQGKKIVMLEPRRIAAKSIAHYLAKKLGEKVGQTIGYQIKNDRKISKNTVLEIVTEGILTRRLQNDPEISDIGLIIFDEFHERSIHADLSLLLALEIQQTIREDLKLLVMSATIDTALVANYMGGADVLICPGRAFPVTLEYTKPSSAPLSGQVTSALDAILHGDRDGDILVFLPGQTDIKRCLAEAKQRFGADSQLLFLPLYGGLSLMQQESALTPDIHGKRRIVFTTNIAETSLTIEGVTHVIDSGLEKSVVYDPTSGMTRLETSYISKASADQRKGRAGRTQSGACVRLWDENKQCTLRDYQGEEILSADLCGFVLELLSWGAGNYDDINWLTPPPKAHFSAALATLASLGLINADNTVTALGVSASSISLTPRLAAMLLQAKGANEKAIACELAALLSDRDIFHLNTGVDIVERLLAVQDYKTNRNAALKAHPVRRASVEQLLATTDALKRMIKLKVPLESYSLRQLQDTVGKLLLYAFPDRLAKNRSSNEGRYQLANGRGVFLFGDDPLYRHEWLVVADCDAQKKEGRIYTAASISYQAVLEGLGSRVLEVEKYEYSKEKQKIGGRRTIEYAAITLSSHVMPEVPPEKFQACLRQVLSEHGLDILNWTPRCAAWLFRAEWLGEHLDVFPKLSKSIVLDTIDEWLLPYITNIASIAALKKVNIFELLVGILSWDNQQVLDKEAPSEYLTPSNKSVPIAYDSQQGPLVSVQLQELFGEISTPKIGGGTVPIRFELLSPARRPIQTTSDLGFFWENSYFDVAKEMRGKYPKHRWPDEPLLEKPGKSIKLRKL